MKLYRAIALVAPLALLVACSKEPTPGFFGPPRADASGGGSDDAGSGAALDGGAEDAVDRLDVSITDAGAAPGDAGSGDAGQGDAGQGDVDPTQDTSAEDVSQGDVFVSAGDPFARGPLTPRRTSIEAGSPVPFLAWVPEEPGRYAVVVMQHGFLVENALYGTVLEHVASHGFVVVAPQMYAADSNPLGKPSAFEEAAAAADWYGWLEEALFSVVDVDVATERLGLVGHSRGAKVIWAVLRDDPDIALAVAGVDPVDGQGGPLGGEDRVLDSPVAYEGPTLILGTGRGPESGGAFAPACAPEGDNHVQFYAASASPAWHLIADDYGHNDMLDEGCGLICSLCPGGEDPAQMQEWTAGLLTTFLRATLQGEDALLATLEDVEALPVATTAERR